MLDVKRVSVVKIVIEKVFYVICAYAPQAGRNHTENEDFSEFPNSLMIRFWNHLRYLFFESQGED